ncbi:DUF488 domain-containing protein, partial [Bordetella pertussis]|uniref:DUF488 domain-containing protein n=1 Tax=Bordetella pertussis TaxID=520 RepID=UPI000A7F6738
MKPAIHLKRAYEAAAPADGRRVLIDGLWPRGLRKDALPLDDWIKDLAPSRWSTARATPSTTTRWCCARRCWRWRRGG